MSLEKFFAKRGTYSGYEMYSSAHFELVIFSVILIALALMLSYKARKNRF